MTEEKEIKTVQEETPAYRGDSLIRELLQTESQLAQQTLDMLRSQYEKEKSQWSRLLEQKQSDAASLNSKLTETEEKLKQIKRDYSEDKELEMEKLKLSTEELRLRREREQEKWGFIDHQIGTYRTLIQETQIKLSEEKKKFVQLRERYLTEQVATGKKIGQLEEELLKLRENIIHKEQNWYKERTKYEGDIASLKEQIDNLKKSFEDEKQSKSSIVTDKDEEISKLQKKLNDTVAEFNEHSKKLQELTDEIKKREEQIKLSQQEKREILEQVEQERKNWSERWGKDRKDWETHKQEVIEHEETLKIQTEEQVARIKTTIESLEQQIATTRNERQIAENIILEKQQQIEGLGKEIEKSQQEKLQLQKKIDSVDQLLAEEKQKIDKRYGDVLSVKNQKISSLQDEMSQLKANIAEEERLFQLEKTENNNLKVLNEHLKEDKEKFVHQIDQERTEWKKALLEEQIRDEGRLKDLAERTENAAKSRDDQIKGLQEELTVTGGQLNELRVIYQEAKVQNGAQQIRIKELEAENQKLLSQWENERKEWDNLLLNQRLMYEERKAELIAQKGVEIKDKESEIKSFEAKIGALQGEKKELKVQIQNESDAKEFSEGKVLQLENKLNNYARQQNELMSGLKSELEGLNVQIDELHKSLIEERLAKEKAINESRLLKDKIATNHHVQKETEEK